VTGTRDSRAAALRLLLREIRPVTGTALIALAVLTVSVLATLAGPMLVQRFVDRATTGTTQSVLITIAVWYLVIAVTGGAARICSSYLAVHAGWRIADSLRMRLLRNVAVDQPVLEVENRPVGQVLEQVSGSADIVGLAIATSGFRMISNVLVGAGTVVAMSLVVPQAGVGILVLIVVVCFVLTRLSRRSRVRWEKARGQQAKLFGFVGDAIGARDDLLVLGRSQWAADRTRADLAALLHTEGRAYISGRIFWPVTQLCTAVFFAIGFGFGLRELQLGSITIGTLTMIYLYVNLLQGPLEDMSSQSGQMQQMFAVLAIAARTLPAQPATDTEPAAAVLPDGPLGIEFDHVTFGYGDTPVLRDVSFTVAPGRSLGIVGPTGAGKSTVINLLCGLGEPGQGRVRIGGVDVRRLPPLEFARRVTVLSQRAHVFSASVYENITLFDDSVSEDHVWQVLDRLNAADWVRDLPAGLRTRVGSDARTLSEGESQVLVGARALLRPYSVLVVDEGTSRFDAETERSWTDLLELVMRDRTVVLVEHRMATLVGVDELMTLEGGRVVDVVAGHLSGVGGTK
jgi:ATP-binding cassette subfamily B protein